MKKLLLYQKQCYPLWRWKLIFLLTMALTSQALYAQVQVSGVVTEANGAALPGVKIEEKWMKLRIGIIMSMTVVIGITLLIRTTI